MKNTSVVKNKGGRPKGSVGIKAKRADFLASFHQAANQALSRKNFDLMRELIKAVYSEDIKEGKRAELLLKILPYCYPMYKGIESTNHIEKTESIQVLIQNNMQSTSDDNSTIIENTPIPTPPISFPSYGDKGEDKEDQSN